MVRRDLLTGASVASLAALGFATSGCKRDPRRFLDPRGPDHDKKKPLAVPSSPPETVALLNRAAFGPSQTDLASVLTLGRDAWLEEQLSAPNDDNDASPGLRWRLRGLLVERENPYELRDTAQGEILEQLQRGALLRAVYSSWQLRERMVDFWTNHFNIYARKVFTAGKEDGLRKPASELMYFIARDQRDVVRANALGNVKDLVRSSMRSTAMAGYLDNQVNRKGVPNENYARELLELHTLGVDGGYTQNDVQEVARALTGWRIETGFLKKVGTLVFDSARHDNGEKRVLGSKIPAGGGEADAERVLEIVTRHESCGKFLGKKLASYFYGDGPKKADVAAAVAAAYKKSDGDIKAMLRALFSHPAMKTPEPAIKRPLDFLVSALRATDALTDGGKPLQQHLENMGQPLHQWPMPDGYPDSTAAWTGSLLARWNFALALATGGIGNTKIDTLDDKLDPKRAIELVFQRPAGDESVSTLRETLAKHNGPAREMIALALCSPAFQWR